MSLWEDNDKLEVELFKLGSAQGDRNVDDNYVKLSVEDDPGWWRGLVNAYDNSSDGAYANYGEHIVHVDTGQAEAFGKAFIDAFNKAYFDRCVYKARQELDSLEEA